MLGFALMLVRVENCLFVCFCFKCFYIFVFDQSFLVFMLKIQKHIKIENPKKVDRHRCVLSQNIFCLVPLYKWPCAFKSVACSLSTSYLYRTLRAFNVIFSCILCILHFFCMHCFVFYLTFIFQFCVSKKSKTT